MASGLAAAHAAGVVHRDLKPANIMIDSDGEAMIMDFGVARSTGAVARSGDKVPRGGMPSIAGGHTLVGMIVGTVEYMAPEQAKAEPVDHRADIYAFGLILYDLLVGRTRQKRAESALAELTAGRSRRLRQRAASTLKYRNMWTRSSLGASSPMPQSAIRRPPSWLPDLDRLDDAGYPLPIVRRITKLTAAAASVAVLGLLAGTWWVTRPASRHPSSTNRSQC